MQSSLEPLASIFDLNTQLFRNCLAEVDEERAALRPGDRSNSLAFIAAHLVETRVWMGGYLDLTLPAEFEGRLAYATSIDDIEVLPTGAEIRDAWDRVTKPLGARMASLTEPELSAPSPQKFPGVPPTVLGGVAFLIQHESYHIGQMAYLRKYLGLAAMSYG